MSQRRSIELAGGARLHARASLSDGVPATMTRALCVIVLLGWPATGAAEMPAPWTEYELPSSFGQLRALACADEVVFARSWQGSVARNDGGQWTMLPAFPVHADTGRNLWTNRAGSVLFTTLDTHAIARWKQGRWTVSPTPNTGYPRQIISFDDDHAIAVGQGIVVAWDGYGYSAYDGGTWRVLSAVWGLRADDFWVGGGVGTVLHFDGQALEPRRIATQGDVNYLWGRASDDVWAVVRSPGGIFHWAGERWEDRTGALRDEEICQVGGNAEHVYAVGAFGVARWDEDRWRDEHRVPTGNSGLPRFQAVCATRRHIVVGGDDHRVWMRPLP